MAGDLEEARKIVDRMRPPPATSFAEDALKWERGEIGMTTEQLEEAIATALANARRGERERAIKVVYLAKNELISIGKAIEAINEGKTAEDLGRTLRSEGGEHVA